MRKQTYFFPHDCNSRSDEKVRKMIRRHGMTGFGVFWSIIEDLYINDNRLDADCDDIAYALRVEPDIVKSVINDFGLFKFDGNQFSSASVQSRLEEMAEKSEKARQSINRRWNKGYNTNTNVSDNDTNVLFPDTNVILERKGKEKKERKEIKESSKRKRSSFMPPTLEQVKEYFKFRGYTEESAVKAWNHYDLGGWHDTSGKPVLNWKQKMNTVWLKPENMIAQHKMMMP